MLVELDDLSMADKSLFRSFYKTGFLRLKVERVGGIVLEKFTDDTYQEKTHYIHLVDFQKELWNNLIIFRDYLIANETAKNDYLEIKRKYFKNPSTGIKEYTDFKEHFVKVVTQLSHTEIDR
ncbi:hypothetical protein GCM10022410_06250 [Amphibacillus indicireducens]|uniref:Uncharacterized protein n=1 Tax=Amphibacillus indicireducens TaxID=1076330 RepID=A0ABP7V9H5_9BACI